MKKALTWAASAGVLVTVLALAGTGPTAASAAGPAAAVRPASQLRYAEIDYTGFNGVLAVSARNVWAVGENSNLATRISHWNGTKWSGSSTGPGDLRSVAGSSASDVWAVGSADKSPTDNDQQSLAEHWNGKDWTGVSTPSEAGSVSLNAVAATSPRNAWAVGAVERTGPGVLATTPLIEHWNGKAWTVQRIPVPRSGGGFYGVAVTSPSNAWAVGFAGSYVLDTGIGPSPLIERWNGKTWTRVPASNPVGISIGSLRAVTAVSSGNVWAVGGYVDSGDAYQTLIMHWNGRRWVIAPSPTPSGGAILEGVSASGTSDIWAVGTSTVGYVSRRNSTLIEHLSGTKQSWKAVSAPGPRGTNPVVLFGVSSVSRDDVWAVGYDGSTSTLVERWNGKTWG